MIVLALASASPPLTIVTRCCESYLEPDRLLVGVHRLHSPEVTVEGKLRARLNDTTLLRHREVVSQVLKAVEAPGHGQQGAVAEVQGLGVLPEWTQYKGQWGLAITRNGCE